MKTQDLLVRSMRGAAMVGLLLSPVVAVQAQLNSVRTPDKNAMYIMVPAFRTQDARLAQDAAAAMRSRLDQDFPRKEVWVIPSEQIDGQLKASGFPVSEALQPNDAQALARILRANEYIDAQVTRTPTAITVTASFVLSRDNKLVQPLGTFTAPRMGDVMALVSREYKEARKQLDGEQKCANAARDSKYPEAMEFARSAIALYPKSTLARICLATVLSVSNAPTDSVLKISREIRAIDPKSSAALRLAVNAFKDTKYQEKNPNAQDSVVTSLTALLATDPGNPRLQTEVIYEMGKGGDMKAARTFADSAVAQNPGDPELLKMRWLLLFTTKDYKAMDKQGEELVRLDTAFADTTYFKRTALAFAQDSQPQKAAEAAARGLVKFPAYVELASIEITALKQAGQLQQALEKLDRAETSKMPIENAGQLRISLLQGLHRDDEVLPVIRDLVTKGDTTSVLRFYVIQQGGTLRDAGVAGKDTTMLTKALGVFSYADSISKGNAKAEAQFGLGATNVYLANTKIPMATAEKANGCKLWKEIKNHVVDAQIQLPAGGKARQDAMGKLMPIAMQTDQYASQQLTALKCK